MNQRIDAMKMLMDKFEVEFAARKASLKLGVLPPLARRSGAGESIGIVPFDYPIMTHQEGNG